MFVYLHLFTSVCLLLFQEEECDEKCHHDSMCAIAFLRVEDMQRCLEISDEQMLELGGTSIENILA